MWHLTLYRAVVRDNARGEDKQLYDSNSIIWKMIIKHKLIKSDNYICMYNFDGWCKLRFPSTSLETHALYIMHNATGIMLLHTANRWILNNFNTNQINTNNHNCSHIIIIIIISRTVLITIITLLICRYKYVAFK